MDAKDFDANARAAIDEKLLELNVLSFQEASALPGAFANDIVVAGKEVQLAIFRQSQPAALPDDVLVTVQLTRAGLGGRVSYQCERGLVYSANGMVREATENELLATAS